MRTTVRGIGSESTGTSARVYSHPTTQTVEMDETRQSRSRPATRLLCHGEAEVCRADAETSAARPLRSSRAGGESVLLLTQSDSRHPREAGLGAAAAATDGTSTQEPALVTGSASCGPRDRTPARRARPCVCL